MWHAIGPGYRVTAFKESRCGFSYLRRPTIQVNFLAVTRMSVTTRWGYGNPDPELVCAAPRGALTPAAVPRQVKVAGIGPSGY